jgi:hypothetical protein
METFTTGTSNYHFGTISSGTGGIGTTQPNVSLGSYFPYPSTVSLSHPPLKQIMQNKVAVFQIVRDEDDKIIKTEFIKELWVETKNGQSVDFQVARDKDLAEYEMSDLSIRTIHSVTF